MSSSRAAVFEPGYASGVTLRFCLAALVVAVGCTGAPIVSMEAGFYDAREVIVDPRDGVTDVPSDGGTGDVLPTVDVVVFDASTLDADGALPDASSPPDAPAPSDRPWPTDFPAPDLPPPKDVSSSPCAELAERYAAVVREGQACVGPQGCTTLVCETLCCACEVFVSPTPERMRQIDELRVRAATLGCTSMLRCPTTRCPPARSGACSADGRCITLRESLPDAGADVPSSDGSNDR